MPIFIVPIAYAAPYWEILLHAADNYHEFDSQKARRLKGVALAANRHQTELIAIKQALLSLTPGQEVVIATYEEYVLDALNNGEEPQQNQALIADIKRLMAQHHTTASSPDDLLGINPHSCDEVHPGLFEYGLEFWRSHED